MKPQNEEQKLVEAQGRTKTKKPRFQIEKLEERIAPAKGGIPGPPDDRGVGGGGGCGRPRSCG